MSTAGSPSGTDSDLSESPDGPSLGGFQFDVDKTSSGRFRKWKAIERTTGEEASGPSWAVALLVVIIALLLKSDDEDDREDDSDTVWADATSDVKQRFDEENVTDEDVEDAIEWARSQ